MALVNRMTTIWTIRAIAAVMLALAALSGMTGRALAHDNDNEVVNYGPAACTTVADLPVYRTATCQKHKTELDDGVTETSNSYVTPDSANSVRLAFEQTFVQQGWRIIEADQDAEDQEWEYTVVNGARRVEVKVEPQDADEGAGTEFKITEK